MILNEGLKETYKLQALADNVIEKYAKVLVRKLSEYRTDFNDLEEYRNYLSTVLNNGIFLAFNLSFNDVKQELKDFYRSFIVYLRSINFNLFIKYTLDKASFNPDKKTIILYENGKKIIDLIIDSKEVSMRHNINFESYLAYKFGLKYKSSIIHELQHAYDFFKSEKSLDNKEFHKFQSLEDGSDKKIRMYYKLTHEVNARFAQFLVDNLPFNNVDTDVRDNKIIFYYKMKKLKVYLSSIKFTYLNFYLLSQKQKVRLYKRLIQFYYDCKKNFNEYLPSTEIEDNVLIDENGKQIN